MTPWLIQPKKLTKWKARSRTWGLNEVSQVQKFHPMLKYLTEDMRGVQVMNCASQVRA